MKKQSPGVDGAMTTTGDSLLRPYSACMRSACSVLVGNPVLGPPRWISKITSGSSAVTASPMASPLSAMPGPLDAVTPRAPPKEAPMAEVAAAISSSAWNVRTRKLLCSASSSRMLLAGVMG